MEESFNFGSSLRSWRLAGRLALALTAGVGLLAAGAQFEARAQQPIVIKFSHVVAPDTPQGQGAEKFK